MKPLKCADSYRGRLIVGIVGLFGVLPTFGLVLGRLVGRGFDGYTAGIYVGTGMAVLWYTVETHYLRRAMVRANEIAIHPLVITSMKPSPNVGGNKLLVLRNIGKGPALFVQIKDTDAGRFEGAGTIVVRFHTVDVLEEKQDAVVDSYGYVEETGKVHKATETFLAHLDPQTANRTYEVAIGYQDTSGAKHESVMQMGKDGIRLLRHS